MYASGCLFPFFSSQANATTISLPTSTLEIQRFPREPQRSTGAERPERGAGSEPITATVIPQISGVQTCSTVRVLEWKDGVATLPGSNLRVSVALGHCVCRSSPLPSAACFCKWQSPAYAGRDHQPAGGTLGCSGSLRLLCPITMPLPSCDLSRESKYMVPGVLQQVCPAQGVRGLLLAVQGIFPFQAVPGSWLSPSSCTHSGNSGLMLTRHPSAIHIPLMLPAGAGLTQGRQCACPGRLRGQQQTAGSGSSIGDFSAVLASTIES